MMRGMAEIEGFSCWHLEIIHARLGVEKASNISLMIDGEEPVVGMVGMCMASKLVGGACDHRCETAEIIEVGGGRKFEPILPLKDEKVCGEEGL